MSAYLPAIAAGAAQYNGATDAQLQQGGFINPDVNLSKQNTVVSGGPSLAPWINTGFGSANPLQDLGGYATPQGMINPTSGQDGGSNSSGTPVAPAGMHWEASNSDAGGYTLVANPASDQVDQFMTALHKYDPNASITSSYGGDQSNLQSHLNFDPTMIPGADSTHGLMSQSQFKNYNSLPLSEREMGGSLPFQQTPTDNNLMFNPNDKYNSNTWGNITPNFNLKPQQDTGIWKFMDTAAPIAITALLGGAFGAAGAGLLGGAMGGGALADTVGSTLGRFGMQEVMSGGHASINPLQLAESVAGGIPGVGSVMNNISPYLRTGANIYNAVNGSPWGLLTQGAGMAGNILRGH
ncbi:MAG: hypothetical protein ACYC9R_06450 [Nitrosotalea sp.]